MEFNEQRSQFYNIEKRIGGTEEKLNNSKISTGTDFVMTYKGFICKADKNFIGIYSVKSFLYFDNIEITKTSTSVRYI